MITKKPKLKTCRECKCKYTPIRILSPVCEKFECKVAYATKAAQKSAIAREKRVKRETKTKLEGLKTRQEYLKDAQRFFNQYIRLRDEHLPCISCARFHQGQYHAGHFRTIGSSPNLRFSEDNCHKQCAPCNNHLSGNIIKYRPRLIEKIGIERVIQLEADNTAKHYTIEEIKAIKVKYKQLIRELKNEQTRY